jgi:hypothetical protein
MEYRDDVIDLDEINGNISARASGMSIELMPIH